MLALTFVRCEYEDGFTCRGAPIAIFHLYLDGGPIKGVILERALELPDECITETIHQILIFVGCFSFPYHLIALWPTALRDTIRSKTLQTLLAFEGAVFIGKPVPG